MFFRRSDKKDGPERAARRLQSAATAQSRRLELYGALGAPDTVDGRFELLTMHVILLLERLGTYPSIRQHLFDIYVSDLDGALREMGTGDLSMGRRMKTLGQVFYGRAGAFKAAFGLLPDDTELRAVIARTLFQNPPIGDAAGLATYASDCRRALAECPIDALLAGDVRWGRL
jgi:cytochrome b pre-mRNA-processing protein 3